MIYLSRKEANIKTLRVISAVLLLLTSISVTAVQKDLCAMDEVKSGSAVRSCQERIGVEREAIIEDKRKLQEAKKSGDAVLIEKVKQETTRDIAKIKTTIKAIYKEMGAKTANHYVIDYRTLKKK